MNLTQCPNCHHQCFTDASSCLSCGQTFQPGQLEAQAVANERALSTKAYAIFLSLFLASLALLVFVEVQAYINGVGFFRP